VPNAMVPKRVPLPQGGRSARIDKREGISEYSLAGWVSKRRQGGSCCKVCGNADEKLVRTPKAYGLSDATR
jgi:hypothetical protein